MIWAEQLRRIRRMLRDPSGNIWTDAQLLHMFNQEQQLIFTQAGGVRDVKVSKIPPHFYCAYCYDWEWGFSENTLGDVLQWGYFEESEAVCTSFFWELQQLQGMTPDVQASGEMWVHPWEAWYCTTPAESPPIPCPTGFHKMIGIYWDKAPIGALTRKEVMDDQTWRNRQGESIAYYRDDKLTDFILLHPIPSVVDWGDDFEDYLLTSNGEIILDSAGNFMEV